MSQQPSMQHFLMHHFAVVRACLLLGILGVWCVYLGGHGGVAAFAAPGRLQQQRRMLGRRSCLSRGGPQSIKRRTRWLTMDAEGAGAEGVAVPLPKTYSRNGRWTVYSSGSSQKKSAPSRVLSKEAQAKREKEHELGTKIQRMVKLQKLKDVLTPASGEEAVSNEAWAEAAGETVEALREALEEGASAKQEMVLSNLSLVDIIVKNYVSTFAYGRFTATDLKQDATVGLIRAVEKFDPERGFLFSTYGRWWVRKFLHEGVQNHDRMVRIPNSAAYRIAKVKRIRGELEFELGREPTRPELALEAGLTVQQVEACLEQDAFYIERLDKYMGHGFGVADNLFAAHYGDSFVYGVDMLGPHPGEALEPTLEGAKVLQVSLREDLSSAFVRLLDATERECLVLRYGLHDGVTNSIEETAEIMDFCDPDDVRIITTQAMAKLRDGCLPEERKKLMSYLSVYEPKSTNYSKTKYNPARSKSKRDSSNSSIRSSIDSIGSSSSSSITNGSSGPEDSSSATSGETTDIDTGRPGWMEDSAGAEASAVAADRNSKGEERRGVWEATMESQELISAKQERRGGVQKGQGEGRGESSQEPQAWDASFSDTAASKEQQEARQLKVNSNDSRGEERQLWDFSKHGQEELQEELTRYLRRHRRAKKNAEKAAALATENALAAEEKAAAAAAGAGGLAATTREEDEEAAGGTINNGGSTARRKKVTTPRARRASSSTRLGRYTPSAVDLARQQREERQQREGLHLEAEERAREAEEEEWRREEEGRPIPVGNGAGSAVVGDLEPVPNSREADQLEHLSRLLWDGEEEPEEFALSYGKPPKGQSLQ